MRYLDLIKTRLSSGTGKNFATLLAIACLLIMRLQVHAQTNIITTIAGNHTSGYSGDGGPASAASFAAMIGVVPDAVGNIYVADETNCAIRKIDNNGKVTTLLKAFPYAGSFGYILGIAVDAAGNIYSSYGYMNAVLKLTPAGVLSTVVGGSGSGYSGDGGPATAAGIRFPLGLATDNSGNLYFVDMQNSVVRKIDAATGKISTIAGTGTNGFYVAEGRPATAEPLYWPSFVAVGPSGNVYITDGLNGRVMKVDAVSGKMYTAAGNGSYFFSGDGGPATAASLKNIGEIVVDASENLYIADAGNNRIRKVDASGIITTIAGTGIGGYNGDKIRADTAQLNYPQGLGLDVNGNPYITDNSNYIIRKITPPNGIFFTGGTTQKLAACSNASIAINNLLTITDTTLGETVSWGVAAAPAHGTLAASYTTVSSSASVTPVGLKYTPAAYYTGSDSFVVRATNGSVTVYTTIMVTVSRSPAMLATADYSTICNGSTDMIKIAGDGTPGAGDTIMSQYFNSFPGGWSVDTSGCVGSTRYPAWNAYPDNYLSDFGYFYNPDSSSFGLAQAFGAYSAPVTKSRLISPSFSLSGYADAVLYFDMSYRNNVDTCAEVDISADGGVTWTTLVNYATSYPTDLISHINPFLPKSVSLRAYAGKPNLMVRFYLNSKHGFYWAVDNIAVVGYRTGINAATWSPASMLFSNAGITAPYTTGNFRDTVYMHPTGVAATTTFTYYFTETIGHCSVTDSVKVTVTPSIPTLGKSVVCVGAADTFTNANPYGLWSVTNAHASITYTGVLTGVTAGVDTVVYTTYGACGGKALFTVTVSTAAPVAGTITGASSVCIGATVALSDAAPGGVWSTGAAGIASVGSTGVTTGVAPGSAVISYTVTNGCGSAVAVMPVTVDPLPVAGAITGAGKVCTGASTVLTDPAAGGVWTSAGTSVAAVSGGMVTGISAGTAVISYAVPGICGTATAITTVTVMPLPAAGSISGAVVCSGATISLSDAAAGGTWSSSAAGVATVTGGVVSGIAAGTAVISYTVTNLCGSAAAVATITVKSLPAAGTITGSGALCVASATSLSDAASGGIWSSGAPAIAAVSSAGSVTGVAAGTAVISYTVFNSCGAAAAVHVVTVSPLPAAGTITGAGLLCASGTLTLSNSETGGIWASSDTRVAAISSVGMVTGFIAGSATISYTVANSCGTSVAIIPITVTPAPSSGIITGASSLCAGSSAAMSNAATGGAWRVSDTALAGISSSGLVTGLFTGSDTIYYSVTNSCGTSVASAVIVILPLPVAGAITGISHACIDSSVTLSDVISGGAWSHAGTTTSVSGFGIVTGLFPGADTIFYSVTNSCGTATAGFPFNVVKCDVRDMSVTSLDEPALKIFPDPARTTLSITYYAPAPEKLNIYILNAVGQRLFTAERQAVPGSSSWSFNVADFPPGLYSIIINTAANTLVEKWIKQ